MAASSGGLQLLAVHPPDRLAEHLWLAAALVLVLLAVVGTALLATRRRAARAAGSLPALLGPPRPFPIPLLEPMPGVALGTTAPRGWQDAALRGVRGNRSRGELKVSCVGVDLAGLWLPRPALRSVRVDERFATKVVPGTGLLVIGWEAGGRQYESGFRGTASGYQEVVAAVRGLLATGVTETSGTSA